MRRVLTFALLGFVVLGVGAKFLQTSLTPRMLPTGHLLSPLGSDIGVGSFPCNLVVSPNGKFLLDTTSGWREHLEVFNATTGAYLSALDYEEASDSKLSRGVYFGLAIHAMSNGQEWVAASHGADDTISIYELSNAGSLSEVKTIKLPPTTNPLHIPNHVAGLAWSKNGSTLYAIANQSHIFNGFLGSVFAFNVKTGAVAASRSVGSFPLSVTVLPSGDVCVTDEGGREVMLLDSDLKYEGEIATGEQPTYETLNHAGTKLYVSNSNSDTISEIDLQSLAVDKTILLRSTALRGYAGTTPLGSVLSADDSTLYVAMADMNAVAVVNTASGAIEGYAPTGWYPTSLALSPNGASLFVACAKGTQTQNPNNKSYPLWGTYDLSILQGSVSKIDLSQTKANLQSLTELVEANNHVNDAQSITFYNPGIEHVFYVIKENRTYDQVLGDMTQGNGEPHLTLFGKEDTPNQHALAARFGLYDNFYACAEVSGDGWDWSTSGQSNEYNQRNTPYYYSGRGRNYDSEGNINNSPVDLLGLRDVSESAGGYIWDSVIYKGLSVRNYGMFLQYGVNTKAPNGKPVAVDNEPNKKSLVPLTCTDYREFDLAFADSDAKALYGLSLGPRERAEYGTHNDRCRIDTWRREFNSYVANKNLPSLSLIRLPRDHTSGTTKGLPTEWAMVADNDYAVGELVDAVSHSPYWQSSVIIVVEDDAQAGFDHVDCHRSNVLVVSPYTAVGNVDSSFYNTDSVLATIERILGSPFGNQYLATARPFNVFLGSSSNSAPYSAILPAKSIIGQMNDPTAYRSEDSDRLISVSDEESSADFELNEILWHSIKGRNTPLPKTPGVIWSGKPKDDDDR